VSGESAAQTLARVAAMYTKVGAAADGVYAFRWPSAPAGAPIASATHTAAVWATRTSGGVAYPKSATLDFVPAGGTPTNREVVSDAACNACHKNLQAHGSRRNVKLCLTCHYPGWQEDGVGIDFRVMVHQIHGSSTGGESAGGMRGGHGIYKLGDADFSHVVFAPRENEVRRCTSCHQGAMADNWKTKPGKVACGSCHVSTAAVSHIAGFDGATCVLCHPASTGLRPIEVVHSNAWNYTTNAVAFTPRQTTITIDALDLTSPTAATATFTVTVDGQPVDLKAADSPFKGAHPGSLRLTIAGPVGVDANGEPSDYGIQSLVPNAPAAIGYVQTSSWSSDANTAGLVATGTPGQFTVTLPNLTAAMGTTVGVGAEGYLAEEHDGELREYPISRPTLKFAKVGGGTAAARRTIADDAKCNACHVNMGFHGGNGRKGVDYCSFCHHSSNVNNDRVSRYEMNPAAPTQSWVVTPESVWLPVMVHRIHSGGALANTYTLGGNPAPSADVDPAAERPGPGGSQHTFAGFFPQPGEMVNCLSCHANARSTGLPPEATRPMLVEQWGCFENPADDTDDLCDGTTTVNGVTTNNWRVTSTRWVPAQQAVCTSCHDDDATAVHVQLNSIGMAESCNVCHGAGKTFDPAAYHVAPR
jgi:OmcA/MtrC family decaheme c-type cytochrome